MKSVSNIGKYLHMMGSVFTRPENWTVFRHRLFEELQNIGINSIFLVALMSVFMGGVISLQTAAQMTSPWLPDYTVGYITQSSTILEFSPTVISLILAGKVGSNVASEIGTMRVTEQIDALEIMGVNSLNYLVLPKLVAAILFFPILVTFSMTLSLLGGWLAVTLTGLLTTDTYIMGIRSYFEMKYVWYALFKTVVFGMIIVTVSSYFGYYTKGGSLDVGRSSTNSVVSSSVVILIANLILTQLILF